MIASIITRAVFYKRFFERAMLDRIMIVANFIEKMNIFSLQKHGSSNGSYWPITPSTFIKINKLLQSSKHYRNTFRKRSHLQDQDIEKIIDTLPISKIPYLQFQNLTKCNSNCIVILLLLAKA